MRSYLTRRFTRATVPSAVLIVESGTTVYYLHSTPEDNILEYWSVTSPSNPKPFRCGGAREQTREQIGTIAFHVSAFQTAHSFLDDVLARIGKLRGDSSGLSAEQQQAGAIGVTQLVQDILRPAAMDAIRERETQEQSMNATRALPVFIVYIRRIKAGKILGEPTSIN